MKRALLFATIALVTVIAAHAQFGNLKEKLERIKQQADAVTQRGRDLGLDKMAKGWIGIPLEEELQIGGSVSLEIVTAHGGLVRDEQIAKRINLLGRALARFSDRPDLPWRFGVLASDSVNAFAAPGGYVFITQGLYDRLGDDDALAAVLGHEIAHITRRHALGIVERGEFMSGAGKFLADRSSDVREAQAELQQFDLGIEKIAAAVLKNGFDPAKEYDADVQGRSLAVITGYAPGALAKVLRNLQATTVEPKKIFSTHPPLAERIKRLPAEPKATK